MKFQDKDFTVDKQLKLNVHKTFTGRSKHYKNVLCTLNLGRVSRSVRRSLANIKDVGHMDKFVAFSR